jgi:hypothetical protein
LCQPPLAAAAGNARTPRQPEGVTKAPALGGRDFGAAGVTEWRCEHIVAAGTLPCGSPGVSFAQPPGASGSGAHMSPDKG